MFYLFPYIPKSASKTRYKFLSDKCWVMSKDVNKIVQFCKSNRIKDYAIETLKSNKDLKFYKEL